MFEVVAHDGSEEEFGSDGLFVRAPTNGEGALFALAVITGVLGAVPRDVYVISGDPFTVIIFDVVQQE